MYLEPNKPHEPPREELMLQRIHQLVMAKKSSAYLFDKVAFNSELQRCIDELRFKEE